MSSVKLTVISSDCRSGYCRAGDVFMVEDLCPPICHELWSCIYPMVYALRCGGCIDCGDTSAAAFEARCPDEGRVVVRGEAVRRPADALPSAAPLSGDRRA